MNRPRPSARPTADGGSKKVAFVVALWTLFATARIVAGEKDGVLPVTPVGLEDWRKTAPAKNPATYAKWELGQMLFWDSRLSLQGNMACVTCHQPEKGWADGKPFSAKANGAQNVRHTMTLYNVAYNRYYNWDGSASSLEEQILAHWNTQLDAGDQREAMAQTLARIPMYQVKFRAAFGAGKTVREHVVDALATFVRSILSGDSDYDRADRGVRVAGRRTSLSPSAKRGWALFRSKARCGSCHAGFALTDGQFHNMGIGALQTDPDPGRGAVDPSPKMLGAFKTPTLRSVTKTAPYSHLGVAKKLDDVLSYFANPNNDEHLDPVLSEGGVLGIKLSKAEKQNLLDFLRSIEGRDDPMVGRMPVLP